MNLSKRIGFTLIELLIVVAVIAILAAIAVPNLLTAQMRSKVSRVKSEIRTVVTALEAYRLDHNRYPFPSDENGVQTGRPYDGTMKLEQALLPTVMTTPASYLSSRFEDPFVDKGFPGHMRIYHYATRQFDFERAGSTDAFDGYVDGFVSGAHVHTRYYVVSHGPDTDHDFDEGRAVYDPTNGATSNGDIIHLGPGRVLKDD